MPTLVSTPINTLTEAVHYLRTPTAIRERAAWIFDMVSRGNSAHFSLHPDRLDPLVQEVQAEILLNYPTLEVPYHSRWRHFDVGGIDRETQLSSRGLSPRDLARSKIELAIVSVLLDAGAGSRWSFDERLGSIAGGAERFARSEGLAVASFRAFERGVFGAAPCTVHATQLLAYDIHSVHETFQVSDTNPLEGAEGRAALMRSLGAVVRDRADVFGVENARLGNLFDYVVPSAEGFPIVNAGKLLSLVLDLFAPIWPGRVVLGGTNMGDTWRHAAIVTSDLTNGLVPIHKLSQWLTYSLLEPLQGAGCVIEGVEGLTGLAEYRNGGLFVDGGVLSLKEAAALDRKHEPSSELVVEWRALTIHLLDRVAEKLRISLGKSDEELPLAKVLQGGTWSLGRKMAQARRASGSPPLSIVSDGTVF